MSGNAGDEARMISRLKERVSYLERINQQYISTLDMLNSLGDIHGNVEKKRDPKYIFTSTRQYLYRLARFDMTAFLLVDESDNSFEINDCTPPNQINEMREIVDQLIETGEFGWALNQNRICEPQYRANGRRILLHVLASRTRIRGMFVGVLNEAEGIPSIMTLGLISAILYNSAYALESALLYKVIMEQNEKLEDLVAERTHDLNSAQQALKKSYDELELRVKKRTTELSEANQQLKAEIEIRKTTEESLRRSEDELIKARRLAEDANHAKSDFLSKMSHELRTPLNAILGFSQVMELDEQIMNGPNADSLQEIKNAGEHLLTLINEVLDLTKIEAGQIDVHMENICLCEVLRECRALIVPLAKKRNIRLVDDKHDDDDIYIYADRTLLKQVLLNLLSNAIKYNVDGGKIYIHFEMTDNRIAIRIADTGLGIREDKQQYLFQPFNRLGAESSNIEGTGIGLVITKHLVNLMDGVISYQSEQGKGTEFQVDFPLGFASYNTANEDSLTVLDLSTQVTGFQLLYIEDNEPNIRLVKSILSRWPQIQIDVAGSAEEGFDHIKANKPDVILMDINLPGISGLEAVQHLKADAELRSIPVIALSANAMKESIRAGLDAGFERYLTKPLKMIEFLNVLGQVVKQALIE